VTLHMGALLVLEGGAATVLANLGWTFARRPGRWVFSPLFASMVSTCVGIGGGAGHPGEAGAGLALSAGMALAGMEAMLLVVALSSRATARREARA
jgi:hypothetical protein